MGEELFEVFDTGTDEVIATNMRINVALTLLHALFDKWYNDHSLTLGIRRTCATLNKLESLKEIEE